MDVKLPVVQQLLAIGVVMKPTICAVTVQIVKTALLTIQARID